MSLRLSLGALVHDVPRFLWTMRPGERAAGVGHWVEMRNRRERLESAPDGLGMRCRWQWTSDLHLARAYPPMARRLMARALHDWPVRCADAPPVAHAEPAVSFMIGHRGLERLPHLLLTLRSIAAQDDVSFECVVVEQSATPQVAAELPGWVRYLHTPVPEGRRYSRSAAFNAGARMARGRLLVFHDNDMLVPSRYGSELAARHAEGYEVVNLKRFVFYLSAEHSTRVLTDGPPFTGCAPEAVVQNLEAGGSLAVDRAAFDEIGGFDESFEGWGGEDTELWDRALTRRCWEYGYLPIVHLWHAAQAEKGRGGNGRYDELVHVAATERIARLISARDAVSSAQQLHGAGGIA